MNQTEADASAAHEEAMCLAHEIVATGQSLGLPFVAASADIGSTAPIIDPDGKPLAGSLFRWIDPELRYWEDRSFALRSAFVHAARSSAEPFGFDGDRLFTWRKSLAIELINQAGPIDAFGVASAIISPVHLAGGVIGAVVWSSDKPMAEIRQTFDAAAGQLQLLALRFVATYHDAVRQKQRQPPARLTRREIQCLKWAAAGKTGSEIAEIVDISLPTVRFHLNNAAKKLQVVGLAQAVHRATTLGYIGGRAP